MKIPRLTPAVLIIAVCSLACQEVFPQEDGTNNLKKLSGPRLGVTFVGGGTAQALKDEYDALPMISQFGWQFEWRFKTEEDEPSAVVELVPLVGGVDQNLFLPSVSILFGLRSVNDLEVGIGPNLSLAGPALVLAAGFTQPVGQLNIPFNFALVPSPKGIRFSLLFGFNIDR